MASSHAWLFAFKPRRCFNHTEVTGASMRSKKYFETHPGCETSAREHKKKRARRRAPRGLLTFEE
eukprot:5831023-Pleurochrysis_carterae.AAC.1